MASLTRGRRLLLVASTLVAILPQGCASPPRKPAVPDDLQAAAAVPGFPTTIRYFPTDATHVQEFERDFLQSNDAEMMNRYSAGEEDTALPPVAYLAISGGGDNGAFGAGLLNGWTATGTRPQFKLVTGVSTGALIAPFAFLGEAYDAELKSIYTGVSFADIAIMAPVPGRGIEVPMLASGPAAPDVAGMLSARGAAVEVVPGPPGAAATRKLLRSVYYKGLAAAVVEALRAARAAGSEDWLREHLRAELAAADETTLARLEEGTYRHALRRAHEMAAACEMLAELGVPGHVARASQLWLEDLAAAGDRGGQPSR